VVTATPKLVSWNLTRRCNLACGHCYLDAVQRKRDCGDELVIEEAVHLVEEIAELAPGAMLVLTGGEPLLRRDLDEIVAAAAALDLMPVIGTNGVLLDGARAERLRAAGAVGVGISLDSVTPAFHDRLRGLEGAWAGAVAGARAAREAGLALQLQTTLFAENRGELEAMADLAGEMGAMALNLFFLVCTGRGVTQTDLSQADYEETLGEIARLQRERPGLMIRARCAPYMRRLLDLHAGQSRQGYTEWSSACLAGRAYLRITPYGQVTPCPYIPRAAGSVRWQPLREIWETGADFVRLRTELPGGKCGDCDFRVSCGGCRARAAALHGDLMAEDPKCRYTRPAHAGPEPVPPAADARAVAWTPEAAALLARIPGFVRSRVMERMEQRAHRDGLEAITAEMLREHRPGMAFAMARPASAKR
jgi:radical SAM protein with 4Fe4S-binding SPASM domain